ncbi:MAG: phosphatase PAP2 family protein [Pseudomonadota bacterium]
MLEQFNLTLFLALNHISNKNILIDKTLIVLGIIGGLSRVVAGIHYPIDIIGSLIISLGSGLLIISLKNKLMPINQYLNNFYYHAFNKINNH